MNRPVSRIFGGVELAVLLPLSILAVVGADSLMVGAIHNEAPSIGKYVGTAVPLLLGLAAIAALWRVLGAFVFRGPVSFARCNTFWWWLLGLGGLMVVIAWAELHFGFLMFHGAQPLATLPPVVSTGFGIMFIIGNMATILLVPLIHVGIERLVYMRSNNRFDRDSGAISSG